MSDKMHGNTTAQDIEEKVKEKPTLFDEMMSKAMKQVNLPKCDICSEIIASGAMPYMDETGRTLNICMKCVLKSIRYYIKNRENRLEANK